MDLKKIKGKVLVLENDDILLFVSVTKQGIKTTRTTSEGEETTFFLDENGILEFMTQEELEDLCTPKKKEKPLPFNNPILLRIYPHLKKSENLLELLGVDSEEGLPTTEEEFLNWYWHTRLSNCKRCSLCESRTNVVKYDGKVSAKIMVVAEGPGFLEDLTVLPMVGYNQLLVSRCNTCEEVKRCFSHRLLKSPTSWGGRSKIVECKYKKSNTPLLQPKKFFIRSAGQVIDGVLNSIDHSLKRQSYYDAQGISKESLFFFTNVALCRTKDLSGLKDQTPDSLTIKQCRINLLVQLACVQPEVVLLLGTVSAKAFHMETSPFRTLVDSRYGCKIIKDRHPAFIMRLETPQEKASGYALLRKTFKDAIEYVGN